MPTAKQFIERVEAEGLAPDAVLGSLQAELKSSGGEITADDLAKRLVSFGVISDQKAEELLLASGDSFRAQTKPAKPKTTNRAPFDDEDEGDSPSAAAPTKRKKHVKKTGQKGFDSPLILLGTGALALLILCGVGVFFLLTQQSGDELIRAADEAYQSRSYSQAITEYQSFVEDFTGHEEWSRARVQLEITRIRQAVETARDYELAVRLAKEQIPTVEDETAFRTTAQSELGSLLPKAALALAEKADEASQSGRGEEADQLAAASTEALELLMNTKYVRKSLRDDGQLAVIREILGRIERRRQSLLDLEQALAEMTSATDSGDIAVAYETHSALIAKRPELREDARLGQALVAAADAERGNIRLVEERVEAIAAERPTPLMAAVALSNRRTAGSSGAAGVYAASHNGVAYGVSADDGRLLWRRPVGFANRVNNPTSYDGDLLLIDHRHNELLRIDPQTGELKWRAELGSAALEPVVVDTRVVVATESGGLVILDANNGERLGRVDFAQRLTSPPVAGPGGRRLHQPGEHSSLYTLDLTTLECVAVRHLGHAPGGIEAPPVVTGNRLLLIDNVGVQTSVLRSFAIDADGMVGEQNAEFKLDGIATTRPVVAGRRVLVAVNTGQVVVYEVNAGPNQTAMIQVAERPAARRNLGPRFLAEVSGEIWIGEIGMMRSTPSLADERLVARKIAESFPGDRFVAPLGQRGRTLLHARRRKGAAGLTIAATDTKDGRLIWETDVASQPLGPPVVARKPRQGISVTTSTAMLHRIERGALRSGLSEQPTDAGSAVRREFDLSLQDGSRVLASSSSAAFAVAQVDGEPSVQTGRLPGKLACEPAAIGSGWLAPLELGQVVVVDRRGREIATPFQPQAQFGESMSWRGPGVGTTEGEQVAVLADGNGTVYCLAIEEGALKTRSSHRLAGLEATSRAAVVEGHAAVGVTGNRLAIFACPDLGSPKTVTLPSSIAAGPYAIEGLFVLVCDSDELVAVDPASGPSIVWRKPLDGRRLVGRPSGAGDRIYVVFENGLLEIVGTASGETLERIELGQPLATGAVAFGKRLLVGAADSAVLIVNTE